MTFRDHRRLSRLLALVILLVMVGGVAAWADHGAKEYYIFQPGSAPLITTSTACRLDPSSGQLVLPAGGPCIRLGLPAGRAHPSVGKLLMVDVLVGQATPWQYALRQLGLLGTFYKGSQLQSDQAVLGTAPASQLACEDTQEMSGATEDAPVAALSRLGYKVSTVYHGGQVDEVIPGYGAATAGLDCNDLIVAVDGKRTPTSTAVVRAIDGHRPGQVLDLTVRRAGTGGRVQTLTLHPRLTGVPAKFNQGRALPDHPFLGVLVQDSVTYHLPFDVSVDVGDIGGPSAGLAITLGILNALSGGHLTGGHVVAATGTIAPNGAVGDVGGVAQKAVAVSRAGATLFLVPPQELKAARSTAGPDLRVEPVSTLAQALADLRAIGGTIPAPPASSAT